MLGLSLPLLVAIPAGLLLGGSLAAWASQRIRWWPIGLLALALQLVLFSPALETQPLAIRWGPWLYAVSMLGVLVVLARNALDAGVAPRAWALAAAGVALNVVVVVANGGYMPQSTEAAARAGLPPPPNPRERLTNVQPMQPDARLALFGDIFPEPALFGRANVVSVGDVLLSIGVAWWAFGVTRAAPRRRPAPSGSHPISG